MKHAVKKGFLAGKKVIGLTDDLSIGPIDDLTDVDRRIDCLKRIYVGEDKEVFKAIKESYKKFSNDTMKLKDEDIYIWYGNSANEICVMLHILSKLKEKIQNVHTINVSEITYSAGKRNEYTLRTAGELMPGKSGEYMEIKKSMGFDRYSSLMGLWEKLKKENSNLRVYEGSQFVSVDVDYFDEMILFYTNDKKFMPCARTIGEVVCITESKVSDRFIFWRVKELIRSGKIAYRGDLEHMLKLVIKNAKGIEGEKVGENSIAGFDNGFK